jgi:hypothetical protein
MKEAQPLSGEEFALLEFLGLPLCDEQFERLCTTVRGLGAELAQIWALVAPLEAESPEPPTWTLPEREGLDPVVAHPLLSLDRSTADAVRAALKDAEGLDDALMEARDDAGVAGALLLHLEQDVIRVVCAIVPDQTAAEVRAMLDHMREMKPTVREVFVGDLVAVLAKHVRPSAGL